MRNVMYYIITPNLLIFLYSKTKYNKCYVRSPNRFIFISIRKVSIWFFEIAHLNWYELHLTYPLRDASWNCNARVVNPSKFSDVGLRFYHSVGQGIVRPRIKQAKRKRERSCRTEIDKEPSTNNKPLNRTCCRVQTRLTWRSLVNPRGLVLWASYRTATII